MYKLRVKLARWAGAFLAVALLLAVPGLLAQPMSQPSGSQDALELQRTRERFVKERGAKTFYPADKFDLSGLPEYAPRQKVSGTLRIWGNNYLADSGLSDVWEAEFRKFHPDIKIDWNLKSAATAVGALWSGAADIGITGRGVLWSERLAFQRQYSYDITEIVSTTGSYNVAGWSNALGISFTRTIRSPSFPSGSSTASLAPPATVDGAVISNGIGTSRADRKRTSAAGDRLGSRAHGPTSRSIPTD